MTISSVPVDGFRLAYDRTGSGGPPVVVLHGWPGDRTDFADVATRLGADFDPAVVPAPATAAPTTTTEPEPTEPITASGVPCID